MLNVIRYCTKGITDKNFPLRFKGVTRMGFQVHIVGGIGSEGPTCLEDSHSIGNVAPSDVTDLEPFRGPVDWTHSIAVGWTNWNPRWKTRELVGVSLIVVVLTSWGRIALALPRVGGPAPLRRLFHAPADSHCSVELGTARANLRNVVAARDLPRVTVGVNIRLEAGTIGAWTLQEMSRAPG